MRFAVGLLLNAGAVFLAATLAPGIAAPSSLGAVAAPTPFPGNLETYLDKYAKLDARGKADLHAGAPVTRLLDSDPSKEVIAFGAVWIDAPVEKYLAAVRDIERFESGGAFHVTKKVSTPPRLDDFAQLRLTAEDIQDLRACRVAECELKLPEGGIERTRREVDWKRPDAAEQANRLARQVALEFVNGYLEGGNKGLAVYRDASRPTFVAKEFEDMVARLPALGEFVPGVRRYLLEFPSVTLPNSDAFIYWQEAEFGLKPTIRINHMVIAEDPSGAIVANKMLYATHYFWTALEMRALLRDPARGRGFWFVSESRSRSDGLSGFVGRLIRGKVRGEAEKGTAAMLQLTKARLEAK